MEQFRKLVLNLQKRWKGFTQRKLSGPASVLVTLIFIPLLIIIVSLPARRYSSHSRCVSRRNTIAYAEEQYWRKHHRFITGDEKALRELVREGLLPVLPPCLKGGHYTVEQTADDKIVVHCSLPEHDENSSGGRGVGRRVKDKTTTQ